MACPYRKEGCDCQAKPGPENSSAQLLEAPGAGSHFFTRAEGKDQPMPGQGAVLVSSVSITNFTLRGLQHHKGLIKQPLGPAPKGSFPGLSLRVVRAGCTEAKGPLPFLGLGPSCCVCAALLSSDPSLLPRASPCLLPSLFEDCCDNRDPPTHNPDNLPVCGTLM